MTRAGQEGREVRRKETPQRQDPSLVSRRPQRRPVPPPPGAHMPPEQNDTPGGTAVRLETTAVSIPVQLSELGLS